MMYLKKLKLDDAIFRFVDSGKPFVGICLGLQLLFDSSEEFGNNSGLGLIKGKVEKFKPYLNNRSKYPVPQIGWNTIEQSTQSWDKSLLFNIKNGEFMYFVHSYYVVPHDGDIILSHTKYGETSFCSSVKQKNIFACQFHPEKSGRVGLQIYQNLKEEFCH